MSEPELSNQELLYLAGTESVVSEQTRGNTFSKLLQVACTCKDWADFDSQLAQVEKKIKKDFSLKRMPNPWTSASSVIRTCMSKGISLKNDEGKFFGKSDLQKKIKETKAKEKFNVANYCLKLKQQLLNEVPKHEYLRTAETLKSIL